MTGASIIQHLAIVLLQAASLIHARIEQVRDEPWTYHDRRVRLCGEVTEDRSTLYSDTSSHFHGRVGVKLSGHGVSGRNQCVTGYVRRVDGKGREKASQELEVTDAPVRADYVFVAEQAGSS